MDVKYPQHEKLKDCSIAHEVIVEFLEWLDDHPKFGIAEWIPDPEIGKPGKLSDHSRWEANLTGTKMARLIAEFFDIDYDAFEAENVAMLNEVWKINERIDAA